MKSISSVLRVESLGFFILSVWLYAVLQMSWWLFAVLLFIPDIFMVGYLKNARLGARIYNIGHSYLTPLLVLFALWLFSSPISLPIALIWLAHISMDRALGYGLKLETGFKDTHLGKIGK